MLLIYIIVIFEIQMAILEETYNYEQNIAKIFSDHNVREPNFDF